VQGGTWNFMRVVFSRESRVFVAFLQLTVILVISATRLLCDDVGRLDVYLSIFFLFCLIFLSVIFVILYRNFDVFEPINVFIVLVFLFYIIGPIYMLVGNYKLVRIFHYLNISVDDQLYWIWTALQYVSYGVMSFFIGYFWFGNGKLSWRIPNFTITPFKNEIFIYIIAGTGGFLLWWFWVFANGGIPFLIEITTHSSEYRLGEIICKYGMLRWSNLVIVAMIFLIVSCCAKRSMAFYLILFTPLGLIVVYSKATSVSEVVLFLLCLIVLYHYTINRLSVLKSSIFFLFLLLLTVFLKLSFNVSRNWNIDNYLGMISVAFSDFKSVAYYGIGTKLKGLEVFSVILKSVPKQFDYIGVSIIPQVLWKILPFGSLDLFDTIPTLGNQFSHAILGSKSGGYNPTLFGFFYMTAGLPGIILMCTLYGFFSRVFYEYFLKNIHNHYVVVSYSIFFVYFFVFFTRTGSPTVTFQRITYLFTIIFSMYILKEICQAVVYKQRTL
jgi:hypothetical protein